MKLPILSALLFPLSLLLTLAPACPSPAADGDGFPACLDSTPNTEQTCDCNDSDPAIHPDAEEVIDGIDNNCNGVIVGR